MGEKLIINMSTVVVVVVGIRMGCPLGAFARVVACAAAPAFGISVLMLKRALVDVGRWGVDASSAASACICGGEGGIKVPSEV